MKTLVVGAGLSGLLIANTLDQHREVTVVDKSRGVGGRLATRRSTDGKFDHGAQFYRPKDPLLQSSHQRWLSRDIVHLWFTDDKGEHYCAKDGMTALAKDIASDLSIMLNERVTKLERQSEIWRVALESGAVCEVNEVVLTCPIPQSLEILTRSQISYPAELDAVKYSKALVLLISGAHGFFEQEAPGYIEPHDEILFSIADQRRKGVSIQDAVTVTFNAEYSDQVFDLDDDTIIKDSLAALKRLSPSLKPIEVQLKKWRYCQVHNSFRETFCDLQNGIYLAGDGFGGASLNGAARSARTLAEHMNVRNSVPSES